MTTDLTTRLLALGGVIGPLMFVVACTIAGLLRPGYSPSTRRSATSASAPLPGCSMFR